MDQYIINIIPRIIQAGEKINKKEFIVDKKWVKYGDLNYETYRFKRNSIVLVGRNGIVEERNWELLPPDNLYISKDGTGLMFKQAVAFGALLFMLIESKDSFPLVLYDEQRIPNGDVINHIKKSLEKAQKEKELNSRNSTEAFVPRSEKKINTFLTRSGMLQIKRDYYSFTLIDGEAFINYKTAADGKYEIINDTLYNWIKVKKGKVVDFEQH